MVLLILAGCRVAITLGVTVGTVSGGTMVDESVPGRRVRLSVRAVGEAMSAVPPLEGLADAKEFGGALTALAFTGREVVRHVRAGMAEVENDHQDAVRLLAEFEDLITRAGALAQEFSVTMTRTEQL
ncbi:hypothetical protein FHS29_007104 [Saccharothrix tamanrassetensis]|uniref:Uncharacterized protein n=1 Tax=Saccharothrix tamanrassetensis TaxID=1051531 RepID=A0A841CT84_9PSEU|nr:hypothetical protein [Saccharothrix tamanrassetensis]MBB5960480.1 hypothetical protein [Saccharothrix tamanrassetensis]